MEENARDTCKRCTKIFIYTADIRISEVDIQNIECINIRILIRKMKIHTDKCIPVVDILSKL